jgi:hypothetical protein
MQRRVRLRAWTPPQRTAPSRKHLGEKTQRSLYTAVGNALSRWEHAETGLQRLFQLFCETKSHAAPRAYGTIVSAQGRAAAVRTAADEFFGKRNESVPDALEKLLRAYETAAGVRNKIAHGIVGGIHSRAPYERFGYYLTAPHYATRQNDRPLPGEAWWLGAKYFYRAAEIKHCAKRFEHLLAVSMHLISELNGRYKVLEGGDFRP